MRATFVIDEEVDRELKELKELEGRSKSELVREAVREYYLKEKRARENLDFFIDLYNQGVITEDVLFLLLPEAEAEAVVIGSRTGKEAASVAKNRKSPSRKKP